MKSIDRLTRNHKDSYTVLCFIWYFFALLNLFYLFSIETSFADDIPLLSFADIPAHAFVFEDNIPEDLYSKYPFVAKITIKHRIARFYMGDASWAGLNDLERSIKKGSIKALERKREIENFIHRKNLPQNKFKVDLDEGVFIYSAVIDEVMLLNGEMKKRFSNGQPWKQNIFVIGKCSGQNVDYCLELDETTGGGGTSGVIVGVPSKFCFPESTFIRLKTDPGQIEPFCSDVMVLQNKTFLIRNSMDIN